MVEPQSATVEDGHSVEAVTGIRWRDSLTMHQRAVEWLVDFVFSTVYNQHPVPLGQ
jgi:hypothetical protein